MTIFINGDPYPIERGERTVAQILTKVGESPEGYILMEEKDGPPLPLPVGNAGQDLRLRNIITRRFKREGPRSTQPWTTRSSSLRN